LLKGFGLKKDEPKIVAYLKSAAEKGIAGAQNRLAYLHLEGVGTGKNAVEAAKWRLIAQKNGIEDKKLDDMIASLPKADRAKAQAAASEWSDRIQIQGLE
jgi:TPR repeat protein